MICPKCGRSTPGNICPYCDGPEIEDRTDDYIKRKKEYEDILNKQDEYPDEPSDEKYESKTDQEKSKNSFRFLIPVIIVAAAAVAVTVIFNVIRDYRPAPVYNSSVYYANSGKYYLANASGSEEVGDAKNIFFNSDKTRFYRSDDAGSIISGDNIIVNQSMSDDSGRYYACSLYDSSVDSNNYRLFMWKSGESPKEIISSDTMTGLKFISGSGEVFFTKTDVITDELGTGSTSLWYCKSDGGNITKLEDDIYGVYFYFKKDTVIIRNKDDSLWIRNISNETKKVKIADDINDLFLEDKECNNFFKSSDTVVNGSATADRLCYSQGGRLYIYDIGSGEKIDIGSVKGIRTSVYYDDVDRMIYIADSSNISCGIIESGKVQERTVIATDYLPGNIIWSDYEKTALYLSSEGRLQRIKAGSAEAASESAGISNLLSVENGGGYVYMKDKELFYSDSFNKAALFIGNVSVNSLSEVIQSNGYIYRTEGRSLIAVPQDGTNTVNMGECESLWYGEL